ncbi:bifunctional pyr operon transcriptional regulator/uracil phosphoribosyltransferase PyrR [Lacicoccus alkaliphilus]|uniref:Bifunctional protein PyrR n=1 Tax=Lacicoccus alkaliphilus DSM 16010 TaxID=1123231 RepID=A0A1M7CF12_9BACL|nr:bifunctional pyr operon transcriptional regulator/uracil phosphoribosyltransferase PyrR [Salinicoccus alkaliphilus]SHL65803.1 pyrimidine operon attenuation protein / uracil phosphoribosyltransferase [Salinicoccus alkaliphilus DSM 16010]
MKERMILDDAQISRSLTRMAHEVLERNKGTENIILLGIKTRGEFLADRLQQKIVQIEEVSVPTGAIDISNYRDDKPGRKLADEDIVIDADLNDKHVVLVDDVLFTGRTIRAAMDAILNSVRPSKISLAVLIDRGHRELPIRADYVGKNIPTAKEESINVALQEVDGSNAVTLTG